MGSEEDTTDITVLGDTAKSAARLSTSVKQGEILIFEATAAAAGLDKSQLEHRTLELKGKEKPFSVFVLLSE
jgi:class 3 adenylate cyclase